MAPEQHKTQACKQHGCYRETDQINDTFDSLNGNLVNISDSLKFRFKQLLQTQLRLFKYKSFDPETEEFKYLIERTHRAKGTEETNIDVHEDISNRLLLLKQELSTFNTKPPSDYKSTDTEGSKLAVVAGMHRMEMPSPGRNDRTVNYNTKTHVEMMANMNANRNAHQRDQKLTHRGNSETIRTSTPVADTSSSGIAGAKGYWTKGMTGNHHSNKDQKRALSHERPDRGPGRVDLCPAGRQSTHTPGLAGPSVKGEMPYSETSDLQGFHGQLITDSISDESKSVSYRCQINRSSSSPDQHHRTQQRYLETTSAGNRPRVTKNHAINRKNKGNKIPAQAGYSDLTEAVTRNKGKSDTCRQSPPRDKFKDTEYISDDTKHRTERTPKCSAPRVPTEDVKETWKKTQDRHRRPSERYLASTVNKIDYMATRTNGSPESTSIAMACDSEICESNSSSLQTSFSGSATEIETETGIVFQHQSSRKNDDHGQRLRTSCTDLAYSEATSESYEAPVSPPRSVTEQGKSPTWTTDTGRRWKALEEKLETYLIHSGAETCHNTMYNMDRGTAQSSYQNGKKQPVYDDKKKYSDVQNDSPRRHSKRSPNKTSYNEREKSAGNINGHSEADTKTASARFCKQTSPDRISTRNNSALDKWMALKQKLNQMQNVYRHEQTVATNSIRTVSPESNKIARSILEKSSPRQIRRAYTESPSRKSPLGNKALRDAIATRKAMLEPSRSTGSNMRTSPQCICLGCTKSPVRKLSAGNKALADAIATRNVPLEPSKKARSINEKSSPRFTELGSTQCPYRRKAVEDALATRTALLQALSENDHLLDFQNESYLGKDDLDNDDADLGEVLDDENLDDGTNICRNEAEAALKMLRAELNDQLYDFPSTSRLEKERIDSDGNKPTLGEMRADESDPSGFDLIEVQGDDNFEDGTNACGGSDSEVAISMVCTDLKDRLSKRLASSISKSVTEAVEEAVENDANMDRMKATTQALCRVRKSLVEVGARLKTAEDDNHYLQDAEEEVYKSIGDMLSVEERLNESHVHERVQHVIQRLEAVAWLSGSASYRSRVTDDLQPIIAQLRYLEDDLKNGEVREDAFMPFRRVATKARLAREQFQVLLFLVGLLLGFSIIVLSCQMPVALVHVDTPRF